MTEEVAKPPKVFISYAWEEDVKPWVIAFAKQLRKDGVEAVLDQWSAHYGDQLPEFMEKAVRESDFVILICTPKYKKKSDEREGGVGYEGNIITSEIFQKSNHRKFIPVLRKGTWGSALPSWAAGKLSMDLSGDPYSKKNYQDLLRALHGKWHIPPPIGKPPDFPDEEDEDAPPVTPQKKIISKDAVDKFVVSLRSFGRKLFPLLKATGGLFIVGALFWAGSWAVPKFIALVPASQVVVTATQFLVTQNASTSSLVAPTKTLRPTSTPAQLITLTPKALPTEITDAKGVTMRLVPAGEFTMGSDAGNADEKPMQVIYLDSFFMDKYEVTNKLYGDCVATGVCLPPEYIGLNGPFNVDYDKKSYAVANYYDTQTYEDYPVVYINWPMAKNYCEWRGARLPTEAEWEKASRSEDGRIYPWGNKFSCGQLNVFDFFRLNSDIINGKETATIFWGPECDKYSVTAPVGSLGSSPYGIYDLSGNVSEWVSSLYIPYPYNLKDFENSDKTGERVYRGDSFFSNPVRSSQRKSAFEEYASTDLGFRCAYSP